ncbi:MAG: hypothetical protein KatS3mg115_2655 [Candidatus Poribacteria bacterium]|nr:MAG: hypothetical protein KatS3mg115_2655 [Candidatus Poribacteria bacterium]
MKPMAFFWLTGILLLALLLGSGCRRSQTAAEAPPAQAIPTYPDVAPDFQLTDLSGNLVRLSDYRGQGVILDFWATWCPPCVQEIPHFIELYEAYHEKGLTILGIVVNDSRENVEQFVQEKGVPYPVLLGSSEEIREIAEAYGGVQYLPTTFLIRPDGTIYQRLIGYHDKATLESLLPEILPAPEEPTAAVESPLLTEER